MKQYKSHRRVSSAAEFVVEFVLFVLFVVVDWIMQSSALIVPLCCLWLLLTGLCLAMQSSALIVPFVFVLVC